MTLLLKFVPKLEQDYFVVIYCIAIYLLANSII